MLINSERYLKFQEVLASSDSKSTTDTEFVIGVRLSAEGLKVDEILLEC